MIKELIRFANSKYPKLDYLPESAVRHNRRALVRSIQRLREGPVSKWIIDNPVPRLQ